MPGGDVEASIWLIHYSHQIKITYIKYKSPTSNSNRSHQIQIAHIKYKSLTSNTNRSHQIQITHIKYKSLTSNTNRYINWSAVSHWMLSPAFTRSSTIPPFCTIVLWLDSSSLIWSIVAKTYCTYCWGVTKTKTYYLRPGLRFCSTKTKTPGLSFCTKKTKTL